MIKTQIFKKILAGLTIKDLKYEDKGPGKYVIVQTHL